MTPHEHQEQQKARVRAMYSNANDVIEKAPEATAEAGKAAGIPDAKAAVNVVEEAGKVAETTEAVVIKENETVTE